MRAFIREEKAAGMTEYILIVFLIALVAYVTVKEFGKTVSGRFIGVDVCAIKSPPDLKSLETLSRLVKRL